MLMRHIRKCCFPCGGAWQSIVDLLREPRMQTIRPAFESDITVIAAIYGHHVLHGTASFETEAPGRMEMMRRYSVLRDQAYPYLVAETDGTVLGYAYAGPYRTRGAYQNTVEDSIYVRADQTGRGVGAQLLGGLIAA